MTEPTDSPPLPFPTSREELTQQLEALDLAALAHRAEAVDDVKKAATCHSDTGTALDNAVSIARGLGATWQQIGDAAGMTRQSAWTRWGKVPDDYLPDQGPDL